MFCAQHQVEWQNSSRNKTHFTYRFLVVRELLSEVAKQEVHQKCPKTDLRIVQSDRSFRTNNSNRPIRSLLQDQQVGSSNQIAPSVPTSRFSQPERSIWTYFRTGQSDLSYRPTFRTDQSDLSYVTTFRRVVPAPDGTIYLVDIKETHYWGSLVRYMYWGQKYFSGKIETYQYMQKKVVNVLMVF